MKLKNEIMLITYADSLGKNLKDFHTVLDKYYKEAVGGVHMYFILNLCAKFSLKSQPSIYGKYGKWIL